MTINSWPEKVRTGGVLTVFQSSSFTGSVWVTEFEPARILLNALLKKHGFALKFENQSTEKGANVTLETIGGNGMHGTDEIGLKGAKTMTAANIKLPANPTMNFLKDGIPAGGPVKRHILVHELIHGIGLDNGEHDDGGVFVGKLVLSIGTSHGKQQAADGSDSVPPIKLAPATIKALRVAWP